MKDLVLLIQQYHKPSLLAVSSTVHIIHKILSAAGTRTRKMVVEFLQEVKNLPLGISNDRRRFSSHLLQSEQAKRSRCVVVDYEGDTAG
jgi:hypothetical protein